MHDIWTSFDGCSVCVVLAAGLTERQALAMALEESRRAAVAAKHSAMQVRNQAKHLILVADVAS